MRRFLLPDQASALVGSVEERRFSCVQFQELTSQTLMGRLYSEKNVLRPTAMRRLDVKTSTMSEEYAVINEVIAMR